MLEAICQKDCISCVDDKTAPACLRRQALYYLKLSRSLDGDRQALEMLSFMLMRDACAKDRELSLAVGQPDTAPVEALPLPE